MKHILLSATAAIALLPMNGFAAEDVAADDRPTVFDEIIVTAQRREQSVLDVPSSVTVVDSAFIESANVKGAADYLLMVPNVSFRESGRGGARNIQISVRGISNLRSGERVQNNDAFGYYWDEFSIGHAANGTANPPMYDVEAVEVLLGPQGTYFGRGALGGALNIRSKKPTDELYGQIDLGAGTENSFEAKGVVNVPVSDKLFIRTVFDLETTDGVVENAHPTGGNSGGTLFYTRTTVRFQPTENTTIDLQAGYTRERQGFQPMVSTCVRPSFGFDPAAPEILGGIGCHPDHDGNLPAGFTKVNKDKVFINTPTRTINETKLFIGNIKHDFGNVEFASVTGYVKTDMDLVMDLDHSGIDSVDRSNQYHYNSFSQEFRLASTGENAVDWTVGAIYYKDKSSAENEIIIKGFLGPWLNGDRANENIINIDRDGWAVFGEANWHINDRLTLTLGGRYSDDKDEQRWTDVFAACGRRAPGDPLSAGCSLSPAQIAAGPLPIFTDGGGNQAISGGRMAQTDGLNVNTSSTDFAYRVAAKYDISDDMSVYATVSQGYKPATARTNPDSGENNITFAVKEKMTNYEVGVKGTLMEDRVRIALSAFIMRWKNMQVDIRESLCRLADGSVVPNDGTVPISDCTIVPRDSVSSAPKAESKGIELSVQAFVTDDLLIGGTLGLIDAKFLEFKPVGLVLVGDDLAGVDLPNSAPLTASFMAQYNFQVANTEAYIRGNWYFRSGQAGSLVDPTDGFPFDFSAFNRLDAVYGMDWGQTSLTLNVTNVLNKGYHTGLDTFSFGGAQIDVHPRTFMARLTFRSN